jgi:hypothetical protein
MHAWSLHFAIAFRIELPNSTGVKATTREGTAPLMVIWSSMFAEVIQSGSWVTAPAIGAAAITAVFTIAGIVLKDYIFRILEERRSEERVKSAIYERYANPLVISSISLLNRLDEILFSEHRPIYLRGKGLGTDLNPGTTFKTYKKLSTIYRLATVLGWIRACRREYSYLKVVDLGRIHEFDTAIGAFENALADGGWVEKERVLRLCELWRLCAPGRPLHEPDLSSLGIKVDNLIWGHLESSRAEDVSCLEDESKLELCRGIADCLTLHLKTNPVNDASMLRSWPDAFSIIGIREAWIYRDWQSAIGDIMIQPSQADTRKFEVIGYGEFEQFEGSGSDIQKVALRRLKDVFDDLDLSIEDRFDARPRQLRAIAEASADLVLAIDKIQGVHSIVSKSAKEKARRVIAINN